MKINFLVDNIGGKSGGMRVIFIYANSLAKLGHQVYITYPLFPTAYPGKSKDVKKAVGYIADTTQNFLKANRFTVNNSVKIKWFLNNSFGPLPDADAVIATAWPTAFIVNKLSSRKGKKFYFIQNYENWFDCNDLVDATWKLPLSKIVISTWLKNLAQNKFNEPTLGPVINGVDFDLFHNHDKIYHLPPVIGMMYSQQKIKGTEYGIEAIQLIKKKYPETKAIFFGLKKGSDIPGFVDFNTDPPQEKIRKIYSNCDIFISPSLQEGCQLPPMEAMACKCAVVATNVGGVPDYTIPGKTALVVKPKNSQEIFQAACNLIANSNLLKSIAESGCQYISKFTWPRAVEQFQKILQSN
jgi:hypothetical protein